LICRSCARAPPSLRAPAKQSSGRRNGTILDCFVAFAPRNDGGCSSNCSSLDSLSLISTDLPVVQTTPQNQRHSGAARRAEPGIHFATRRLDKWIPDSRWAASGMTGDLPVVPICRSQLRLRCRANHQHPFAYPAPEKRGVSRSSRTLGAGCDGRFMRLTSAARRTTKPRGPDVSTPTSSWRQCYALWPATVTKKPDRRGERGISRSNHCAGKAGSIR